MIRKNQKGFSPLFIVLIIVVIGAIGFGGWYVFTQKDKDTTATDQTTQTEPQPTPTEQATDPSENGKYLVIKEWNVRFLVPTDQQSDYNYFMDDTAQKLSGGPVVAGITSRAFSNGDLKCAEIENTPRKIVAIHRELDTEGVFTKEPAPFKQINGERYYFTMTSCETAINLNGTSQDKKMLSDLKETISSSLEKI